jgi:hypothetical protein
MTEIGIQDTLPSENNTVNASTFKIYNTIQLNKYNNWILSILYNTKFLYVVSDLEKMARSYYNQNPKQFCSTINLGAVSGFNNNSITVYLPTKRNYLIKQNVNTTTLMKILAVNQLPRCWSNIVLGGSGECENVSVIPNNLITLTDMEKVLYWYIKFAPFYVNLLSILKNSFEQFVQRRYFCQKVVFPAKLYPGTLSERTLFATGDYLKYIYSYYLLRSRESSSLRLPNPL